MPIFNPEQSWIIQRRIGTQLDPFLQITEQITVANGKAITSEIIDKYQHIIITGSGKTFFIKKNGIPDINNVVVNYDQGIIYFDAQYEGMQYTASYWGKGSYFLSANRIFSEKDAQGNVTETLKDLTDTIVVNDGLYTVNEGIRNIDEDTRKTNEILRIENEIIRQGQESNRVDDVASMINSSKMILKGSVSTYSDLATTYPTPLIYWTVRVLDTNRLYRFDGESWIYIDSISTGAYDELVMSLTGNFDCGIFGSVDDMISIDCGSF